MPSGVVKSPGSVECFSWPNCDGRNILLQINENDLTGNTYELHGF